MDYFWILVIFLSAICTVTVNFSKSVLMKKKAHLHLEWPKGE